ncbi:MAG: protein translocase subunit SecD [SAR202 cluster bacterium]|nr:protein translocase subunit SecD [SAR202 cluster bacterium]
MRRYAWTITAIVVLAVISGLTLGFQTINLGGFDRGGDTPLGLTLGLDLQGGSHLVYRANLTDQATGEPIPPTDEQMESLRSIVERRANSTGLGEPIIQRLGDDRLLIQLPGVEDPGRTKSIIGETARLEFKHRSFRVPKVLNFTSTDVVSARVGEFPTLTSTATSTSATSTDATGTEPTPEEQATSTPTASESATSTLGGAETATSTSATSTEAVNTSTPYLLVTFTDAAAAEFQTLSTDLFNTALEFSNGLRLYPDQLTMTIRGREEGKAFRTLTPFSLFITQVGDTNTWAIPLVGFDGQALAATVTEAEELFGGDVELAFSAVTGQVDENIGLSGDDLARAYAGTHSATGQPIVNLEFNGEGARKFGDLTARIVGTEDRIAIFLDEDELIAPVVSSVITGGTAFIQGADFTPQRVRDIASLLEAGRLPIPVELIQERQVDAILGADSLEKSVIAGLVGLGLVVIFMVTYYKVPGIVASAALVFYTALNLAMFKLIPVTLTLSGVAASIMAIGMAVDANILVFERLKEELRAGRTLQSSINIGFNRAWLAIRDSHVATLISCVILFWFADTLGTTVVKGFAATLAIGTIINLFTALTVSRVLLRAVTATRLGRSLEVFAPLGTGLKESQQPGAAAQRRS